MNHLLVCGLNYHSVPIAIRERFTIPESCLEHALQSLKQFPNIKEAALLSTCNRTEVYAVVENVAIGLKEIGLFFASVQRVSNHEVLQPNFRLLRDDAALHLFRVAAGLDSMILGEGQIMSQIKAAHQAALKANTAGPTLDALFKFALVAGKKVRSGTAIGRKAVSVSSAAIELGKTLLGGLKDANVCVLGAGKMGQVCLKILLNENVAAVQVANRTLSKMQTFLANNLRNLNRLKLVVNFEERHKIAAACDLVIVSASAPHYLLTKADLESHHFENLSQRHESKPLYIIDISVPRNVSPDITELPYVKLYNADDLGIIVNRNLAERESLIGHAESFVFEVLAEFHDWQRNVFVAPTIVELRKNIEAIRLAQMEKACIGNSSEQDLAARQELEEMSRAIVNQILHQPTIQLKAARDYEMLKQQAETLCTLFNLSPNRQKNNKVTVRA